MEESEAAAWSEVVGRHLLVPNHLEDACLVELIGHKVLITEVVWTIYTQMHGTETMDRLKQGEGSKSARWGWFSLAISPSLFTTRW